MKRFYWENPFVFEAEVELSQIDGAQFTINPIIFHPDEGGQPPDRGMIGDANIIKIEARDGQAVITLDKPLALGKYKAIIESSNRIVQSRRHTAQHVISGIAEKQMGLTTIGVRIGETCTIDFDKKIEWSQAEKLEKLSNEAVMMDLPVATEYGTISDRGRFNQELSEKNTEELRVVVIGDIDKSACCGTHVPSTGMIGSVRISSLEASRQGSRITFGAGMDSIDFGISESTVLRNLRKATSCANDELIGSFAKLSEQISQLNKENAELWEKLIPFELEKAIEISSQLIPSSVALFTAA
ncbi:MAG: alanyl-tRNA editing protein, partial [Caldiserica bacterium]|nr:alanyl-tRNA editing protein [Caldisericota bacterium]